MNDNFKKSVMTDLKILTNIFNKYNVKFFIVGGCILGIYRDSDILEYDKDLDIFIFEEVSQKIKNNIRKDMISEGFTYNGKYNCDFEQYERHVPVEVGWFRRTSWAYRAENKNRFPIYIHKKHIENAPSVMFGNIRINIFNYIENFISEWYGDDWKIPNMNKHPMFFNGEIVRKYVPIENRIRQESINFLHSIHYSTPIDEESEYAERKYIMDTLFNSTTPIDIRRDPEFYNYDYYMRGPQTQKSSFCGGWGYQWMWDLQAKYILDFFGEIKYVADVGCALGNVVLAFNNMGILSDGFEYSEFCVNARHSDRVKWCDMAISIPAQDSQYDLVISLDTIEHIQECEVDSAIKELCRISSKYIFITTPDGDFPESSGMDASHVCVKNKEFWVNSFEKYGFEYENEGPVKMIDNYPHQLGMVFTRKTICE